MKTTETVILTDRQSAAIGRIRRDGGRGHISPDLARQLEAKGIVIITGEKYRQYAYGRPVPGTTLWEVILTSAWR